MRENEDIRTLLIHMADENKLDRELWKDEMRDLKARISKVESGAKYGTLDDEQNPVKFPKPKGEPGRSGKNPKKPGFNLCQEMGITKSVYLKIRSFVRNACIRHDILPEMQLSTIPVKVGAVIQITLRKFNLDPTLEWAVKAIMQTYVQGKRSTERRNTKKENISGQEVSVCVPDFAPKKIKSSSKVSKLSATPLASSPTPDLEFPDFLQSQESLKFDTIMQQQGAAALVTPCVRPLGSILVFMDEEGFFYYQDDSHLELCYDERADRFYCDKKDKELHLDLMPSILHEYIYSFDDGMQRSRSSAGYWEVGFLISVSKKLSPPHPTVPISPMSSLPDCLSENPLNSPSLSRSLEVVVSTIITTPELQKVTPKKGKPRKLPVRAQPATRKKAKSSKKSIPDPVEAAAIKRTRPSRSKNTGTTKDCPTVPMD